LVGSQESHFECLLFPLSVTAAASEAVAVLQHYYGYYRRAIRDALNRSSRKPFQCGGLQGYCQLLGIERHLQQRIHSGHDPYLALLHERVQQALVSTATQAEQLRQTHAFLLSVERYLATAPCPGNQSDSSVEEKPTQGSEGVRRELEEMFSDWMQQAKDNPLAGRLNHRWQSMSETWLPGILHCYDIPGLPRSNLALESSFGALRRAQRRTSGRKETAQLRVFGPGEVVLLSLQDAEILPLLQSVPVDEYWTQRRRQEEREEPRRWLKRLHRDPVQALAQVDEQFYAVVNAHTGVSSDPPDDP
jgi:hypothetical protein